MNQVPLEPPDAVILSHQRSGTHLLQSLLCSHPAVHGRGEFILHYKRTWRQPGSYRLPGGADGVFTNRPGCLNLAIVMYAQLEVFESVLGALEDFRVIHLLRAAEDVARSIAQMEADRAQQGPLYRAHFHVGEIAPPLAAYRDTEIARLAALVRERQERACARLLSHRRVLTVTYEEITDNRQTAVLPGQVAAALLSFLGLPPHRLSTTLAKRAPGGAAAILPRP